MKIKINVKFIQGSKNLIYTNQPNKYKLFKEINDNNIKEIEGTIINTLHDKK